MVCSSAAGSGLVTVGARGVVGRRVGVVVVVLLGRGVRAV